MVTWSTSVNQIQTTSNCLIYNSLKQIINSLTEVEGNCCCHSICNQQFLLTGPSQSLVDTAALKYTVCIEKKWRIHCKYCMYILGCIQKIYFNEIILTYLNKNIFKLRLLYY